MDDILKRLLEMGFLTGSRAFKTNREDSDYDIVYPVDYAPFINDILGNLERTPSEYFAGYFVKVDGKTINLIPVHPHEYLPWYLATLAMKETLKVSGIDNPIDKYSVFMGIVSLFKGTVKKLGTLKEYDIQHDSIQAMAAWDKL